MDDTDAVAEIAHDMRTPLAIILGLCDRLEDGGLDADAAADVGRVKANAELLARDFERLLERPGRRSEGGAPAPPAIVDMTALVWEVTADLRVLARARGQELVEIRPRLGGGQLLLRRREVGLRLGDLGAMLTGDVLPLGGALAPRGGGAQQVGDRGAAGGQGGDEEHRQHDDGDPAPPRCRRPAVLRISGCRRFQRGRHARRGLHPRQPGRTRRRTGV